MCHDEEVSATSPVEVDPDLTSEVESDDITLLDKPWVTIVWNDPVNLMSYVTYVFRTYFGYDKQVAEKLMLGLYLYYLPTVWMQGEYDRERKLFYPHKGEEQRCAYEMYARCGLLPRRSAGAEGTG